MLYPVNIKLKDKPVVVIGGGYIAQEKTERLLDAGARIRIVSPDFTPQLKEWASTGSIELNERPYARGDLQGCFLAVAATNNPLVNRQIYEEGEQLGILVNCVDDPGHCNFFVPAVVQRGDFQLAVSTSGKVPFFAKHLRQYLETFLYEGFEYDLEGLHLIRRFIIETNSDKPDEKERMFQEMLLPRVEEIIAKMHKHD